jgi:pantoate--beta-alanine ligase
MDNIKTSVITSTSELQNWILNFKTTFPYKKIGFVPTMGALHKGHEKLLEQCKKENDLSILSIFVNPTQFNQEEDFLHYPKTFEEDLRKAQKLSIDLVFAPESKAELYPDDYCYQVTELSFSKKLCGAYRPGHFNGVLTVVLKLLNLTQCHRAYFGEKDFQQLSLIRKMVTSFFLPIEIIGVPTVRNSEGLALSSRNQRLSPQGQELAAQAYHLLSTEPHPLECRRLLEAKGFSVEYLEDIDNRRYIAFYVENVRLIDNVPTPYLNIQKK